MSNTGDCTTAFPCALGTVPAGATRTITATFLVPVGYAGPSPIVNVATVSAATPDPDASDNTATAETTLDRGADVGVIKSVSPATVLVGEQATFTVTVSNAGPARALGLVVHDLLPEGLTLDSSDRVAGQLRSDDGGLDRGGVGRRPVRDADSGGHAGGARCGHQLRDDHGGGSARSRREQRFGGGRGERPAGGRHRRDQDRGQPRRRRRARRSRSR